MTLDFLKQHGMLKKRTERYKVLGGGELSVKLDVVADAFSKTAREKIEAAGGTAASAEQPAASSQREKNS